MANTEPGNRSSRHCSRFLLLSTVVATVALGSIVVALWSLESLAPKKRSELEAAERRVTALDRRLARLSRRERLGEWIENEIRRVNPGLDAAEASEYGRLLLEITDKYVSVDPLFLLAVGIIESRFTAAATSHANARGLYQIWPATGRWLAGDLGWEFSEAMLHDPAKNTELAACYLDKLFRTYGDPRLVLAEYNGGPINARRLRNGSDRLAAETRDYVFKVMAVLDGLEQRLEIAPTGGGETIRVAALGTMSLMRAATE